MGLGLWASTRGRKESVLRNHHGIECLRVVAVFAVILSHVGFLANRSDPVSQHLHIMASLGGRWAIAPFFVLAGYFWGKKIRQGGLLRDVSLKLGTRILAIWLFWTLLYLIVPDDIESFERYGSMALFKVPFWRLLSLSGHPIQYLFVGSSPHLWYLVALLWALAIVTADLKYGKGRNVVWIGCGLYVLGLIAGSYAGTPLGISVAFPTRYGPFFGTIFFAIGWYASSDDKLVTDRMAVAVFLAGVVLSVLELYLLWDQFGIQPESPQPYILGTLALGSGLALWVMSKPDLGKNLFLPRLGKYTLGIYVTHYIFVDLFRPFGNSFHHSLSWELAQPCLIFLLSLLLTFILRQNRMLKRFVA